MSASHGESFDFGTMGAKAAMSPADFFSLPWKSPRGSTANWRLRSRVCPKSNGLAYPPAPLQGLPARRRAALVPAMYSRGRGARSSGDDRPYKPCTGIHQCAANASAPPSPPAFSGKIPPPQSINRPQPFRATSIENPDAARRRRVCTKNRIRELYGPLSFTWSIAMRRRQF